MAKIAFLGTGLMGAALAEAAAKRGDDVVAWNRTKAKADALSAFGVKAAATPADAVKGVERVHIMLADDRVVDDTIAACGSLAHAVVVDHSTVSPHGTEARADKLEKAGVAFVHAPVFMSPAACRSSTGVMLAAGARATFERVKPALEKMTGTLKYLGERRDLAAANKLFGNAMIVTLVAGLSDVFAMSTNLGIDPKDALSLFETFNPIGVFSYRGVAMAKGDYKPSFELSMARKDVRLMIETAHDKKLAVLPSIASRMDELLAKGHANDDMGILAVESVPKSS